MLGRILPILGSVDALTYRIPLVGELAVRGRCRATAMLLFYLPGLGGRRCRSVTELKTRWLAFLGRFGVVPTVTREDDNEFEWMIEACPYRFKRERDQGVCDACMDLDRTYTRLLGGQLVILETIPGGSRRCEYVTKLQT